MKIYTTFVLMFLLIAGAARITHAATAFEFQQPENLSTIQFSIYPMPVKEQATLSLTIGTSDMVKLELFDITGKKIKEWKSEFLPMGKHSLSLQLSDVKEGVYFFKVIAGDKNQTRRIVIRNK